MLQEFFYPKKSMLCFSEFSFTRRVWRGACYYTYDIFNNNHSFICNGAKKNLTLTLDSIKYPSKVQSEHEVFP